MTSSCDSTWIFKPAYDSAENEISLEDAEKEVVSRLGPNSVIRTLRLQMEIEEQSQDDGLRSSDYNAVKLSEDAFRRWLDGDDEFGWKELGFEPAESKGQQRKSLIGRIPHIVPEDEMHDNEDTGTRVWIRTRVKSGKVYDWYYD